MGCPANKCMYFTTYRDYWLVEIIVFYCLRSLTLMHGV